MAVVRWLLFVAVAGVAAATWWTLVVAGDAPAALAPRFYCPMHPEIRSPDPGSCPICFMALEPIPDDLGAHGAHEEHAGAEGASPPEAVPGEAPAGTSPVMLTTERRQASGIAVASVTRRARPSLVRWPAVVEPLEGARTEVRVRTDAFVERVVVGESGARVRRGQILAWVYAPEIVRAQEELLAARRWAGTEPRAPGAGIDAAAARRLELLGVPRAEVAAIARDGEVRRLLPLRATSTGTVTAFGAALGTYASPDAVLYEITDYARVRVVATVLARAELARAAEGTARFVSLGAEAMRPLELELLEPTLEEGSRGARARFVADNADGALRVGDVGEVVVEAGAVDALWVPRDAVIDRGRERYVFVEAGAGLFEPRVVTAGAIVGDEREILAGLAAGERVVVRGGFVLDSESRLAAALSPREDTAPERASPEAAPHEGAHP